MNNPGLAATYFRRYEQKYLINQTQHDAIMRILPEFARKNEFGQAAVYSIYYDTNNYKTTKKCLTNPCI
jgi:hypothetical protein